MSNKTNIYFDVTDIVEYAMTHVTVSGIQRCALRIIECVVCELTDREVWGIIKHPLTQTYYLADLSFMRGPYDIVDFASRFELTSNKSRWISRKLRKYKRRPARRLLRFLGLQVNWLTSANLRNELKQLKSEIRPSCLTEFTLVPGSTIVTLGAGWGTDYIGIHELAKVQGCRVVSFIHDIFPITAPHYTALRGKEQNLRFRIWVDYIIKNSDLILCNSRFTGQQVVSYRGRAVDTPNVDVVKFPHEFKHSAATQQHSVRDDINALLVSPFILCVGTIEIRKNIMSLLNCWKEIVSERKCSAPTLVLAGGKGWSVDNVFAFLENTRNIFGTIKIIDTPSDFELEILYKNCVFTVFPSVLEGWGLPIGESLWFGKPVICGNNASMPEVGGPFATYFDHEVPGSLRTTLENAIESPPILSESSLTSFLVTWSDTSASIMKALDTFE